MIGTVTAYLLLAYIRIIDVQRFVDIGVNWKKLICNTVIVILQTIVVSSASVVYGVICSAALLCVFLALNNQEIKTAWNMIIVRRRK